MKVKISNTLLGYLLSLMVIVGLNSCGNSNEGSSTIPDNQVGMVVQNDNYQMVISTLNSAIEQAGSDQMNITIDEKIEVQHAESELYSMTLDGTSSI